MILWCTVPIFPPFFLHGGGTFLEVITSFLQKGARCAEPLLSASPMPRIPQTVCVNICFQVDLRIDVLSCSEGLADAPVLVVGCGQASATTTTIHPVVCVF